MNTYLCSSKLPFYSIPLPHYLQGPLMRIDFIYCKVEYLSRLITVESQGNLTNIDFVFQKFSYF